MIQLHSTVKYHSILISFCNLPKPSKQPILCLKIPVGTKEAISASPVNLGYGKPINSATGLTVGAGKLFALFWAEGKFLIATLRQSDLSPIYYQELPEIQDGHSILATDMHLYVVSTGTDEVIRYDILDKELNNPMVFWRASESGKDTHHVNSIINQGNELFVSAFGPKTNTLWASASNGYIHNITKNIRIKESIYHPHSLSERHGQLYYCESSTRSFCALDGPILKLEGYTRGIGWLSDELVGISSSVGRRISKSTGLIANSADPGTLEGKSNLVVRNITDHKVIVDIDLSKFGPEIYDILVFNDEV